MAQSPNSSAVRALSLELKKIQEEPVEGFRVRLANEDDLFHWEVAIFGPPGTLYESGYFKAIMAFPKDYPYSPPTVKFATKMWHPNVYENGDVCISILHPPVDDPQSGELPSERWNPTQTVRTILLSIISLLNEPNTFSPANVDASVMYRRWRDSKGSDKQYEDIIRKQVLDTRAEALQDQVTVPKTLEEYCMMGKPAMPRPSSVIDVNDYEDDDFLEDEEGDTDAEQFIDDGEDSGNGGES